MKYLKPFLLLICILSLLLVSCEITVKEDIYENPDYNESDLDYLAPDPIRQEIDIYWTYEGDAADFQDAASFTFDVKDQTIGYQGKAKDVVVQTIKPERVVEKDEKCYFQIKMGLNYTNDNHVYQLVIKASKDKKPFAQSDIVVEKKVEGTRLTFEAVVKLLP